jgi:hypothetical protein
MPKIMQIQILDQVTSAVENTAGAVWTDADIARFYTMVAGRYPTVSEPQPNDANGNPVPPVVRPATPGESYALWADGFGQGTVANIQSYEREVAPPPVTPPIDYVPAGPAAGAITRKK